MRVSDNNKVIVDMITCVFDSLICKLVLPLSKNHFFTISRPSYLHTLLTPIRKPIQLRSSTSDLLFVPKVNTNMGTRAFAVGAPTLWNMLPSSVKSVENIAKFRRHLKTYLYNLAYPP